MGRTVCMKTYTSRGKYMGCRLDLVCQQGSVTPTTCFLSISSFAVVCFCSCVHSRFPLRNRVARALASVTLVYHSVIISIRALSPFIFQSSILFSMWITLRSICSHFYIAFSFVVLLNKSAFWVKLHSSFLSLSLSHFQKERPLLTIPIPMYPKHCERLRFRWDRKNFDLCPSFLVCHQLHGRSPRFYAPLLLISEALASVWLYSDNILIVHSLEAEARKNGRIVKRLLASLGFPMNSSTRPDDEIHWVNNPLLLNAVKKYYRVEKK